MTPNMQKLIQETVWDMVSKHPYAGIAEREEEAAGMAP